MPRGELLQQEISKGISSIIPTISEIGKNAIGYANNQLDNLKKNAELKKLDAAALQFARDKDQRIAFFGKAALQFLKEKNIEDGELALAIAETLKRIAELGGKYKDEEWVRSFFSYVDTVKSAIEKKELTSEQRLGAYLFVQATISNIANANVVETINNLEKKAENPKLYSKDNRKFLKETIEAIKQLYAAGNKEQADRSLAYLNFYESIILTKNVSDKEGKATIEEAIRLVLSGDENAEQIFKKGLEQVMLTFTCRSLFDTYKQLVSQYQSVIKNNFGENKELEKILAEIEVLIKKRKPDEAHKKIMEFVSSANAFAEKKRIENLDAAKNSVDATPEVLSQLCNQLKQFAGSFPSEIKELLARIEKLEIEARDLSAELQSAKLKGIGDPKLASKLENFSKKRASLINDISTCSLIMTQIEEEKQFKLALKISNVDRPRKSYALEHGEKVVAHLQNALQAVLEKGAASGKSEYYKAMDEKLQVLTMLRLTDMTLGESIRAALDQRRDPTEPLKFFQSASLKVYDACAEGRGFDQTTWKLFEALFNLESAIRKSDDKLFATKEVELQNFIVDRSKQLIEHYSAVLDGKPILTHAMENQLQNDIANTSKELASKIKNADRINEIVKIAVSFVHPAVFAAVTVEGVLKEYDVEGKISWTSGAMLLASAIALRHMTIVKETLALTGFERTLANKVLTGIELGLAGTLTTVGLVHTYSEFKNGNYFDATLNLAVLAIPLVYATVRTPMLKAMKGAYRETSERVLQKIPERIEAMKEVKLPEGFVIPVAKQLLLDEHSAISIKPEPKFTYTEMLRRIVEGSPKEYARMLEEFGLIEKGQAVVKETLYETIIANMEIIKKSLDGVRNNLTFKDKAVLYKALNNEVLKAEELLELLKSPHWMEILESREIGILVMDKGKTWLLNSLGKEFGDLGLFIYFKAIKELEGRFGVPTIRTTEHGDEILIIFPERSIGKMAEYVSALRETMLRIADEMGAAGKLKSTIGSFSVEQVIVGVDRSSGAIKLTHEGTSLPLESIITTTEARHYLEQLAKIDPQSAELLKHFIDSTQKKIEMPEIKKLPEEMKADNILTFRIQFKDDIMRALDALVTMNGKGVSAVRNKLCGPSVLNQLSHPVTDWFSNHYMDALKKSFEEYGLPIEIYSDGPMTIALKYNGEVNPELLKMAIKNTETKFINMTSGKVINVRSFLGPTNDDTALLVAQRIINPTPTEAPLIVTKEAYEEMRRILAILHLEPEQFLRGKKLDSQIMSLLRGVKDIPWVRSPEDLIYYLKANDVPQDKIIKMFETFGINLKTTPKRIPVLEFSKKESFTIWTNIKNALNSPPSEDGVRKYNNLSLVPIRDYDNMFEVTIDGNKKFVYKNRESWEDAAGILIYNAIGFGSKAPRYHIFKDGTMLEEFVGYGDLFFLLKTRALTREERMKVVREAGIHAVIDYVLGIPDNHFKNFRVASDSEGITLMRIDFENPGLGWGNGLRPDRASTRDLNLAWGQIKEIYDRDDLRAFVSGIIDGIKNIKGINTDAIIRIMNEFKGKVYSRSNKESDVTVVLDDKKMEEIKNRIERMKKDPIAVQYQLLDGLFWVWKYAALSHNTPLAHEAEGVFVELLPTTPENVLKRWKGAFEKVKKPETEEIRALIAKILNLINDELKNREK